MSLNKEDIESLGFSTYIEGKSYLKTELDKGFGLGTFLSLKTPYTEIGFKDCYRRYKDNIKIARVERYETLSFSFTLFDGHITTKEELEVLLKQLDHKEALKTQKDVIKPYVYRIQVDINHPKYKDFGPNNFPIIIDGETKYVNSTLIEFGSIDKLSLDEVNRKFEGTPGFRIIKGKFREDEK